MKTGKIDFNPMDSFEELKRLHDKVFMDNNTGQAILKRLNRLIELVEEQNLLIGSEITDCCPGCDGTCGEDD